MTLTLKIANHFFPHNTPAHTKFGLKKKKVERFRRYRLGIINPDKRTKGHGDSDILCVRACVRACVRPLDTLCELFHSRKFVMPSWLRQNLHKAFVVAF